MSKWFTLAAVAAVLAAGAGVAQARDNVYWSIGIQAPLVPGAVSVGVGNVPSYPIAYPAPYGYAYVPAPVYVEPRPIYVEPRPVYLPPRLVYAPPRHGQRDWRDRDRDGIPDWRDRRDNRDWRDRDRDGVPNWRDRDDGYRDRIHYGR